MPQPVEKFEILAVLLVIVSVAAISDLRNRRIPNWLIVAGLFVGLALSILMYGLEGLLTSLYGFGLGFIFLLPGYLLRFTGAGDLKLLSTIGVYTGPSMLIQVFVTSILIAACLVLILGLIKLLMKNSTGQTWKRYKGMLQSLLTTGRCAYVLPATGTFMAQRLPMAPLFAFGVLISIAFSFNGF